MGAKTSGLVLGFLVSLAVVAAAKAEPAVVASIKPIHSLVAAVMDGVGDPKLIVAGAGSPHAHSLRPSQARALEQARVIFWIGPALEAFLEKPIKTLGQRAKVVQLMDAGGITRLSLRGGGLFGNGRLGVAQSGADHLASKVEPGGDEHGSFDPHIWLDPVNAKAMVRTIAATLADADPDHATTFAANADAVIGRLDDLIVEIVEILEPVRDHRFMVFHDAFQYFEKRFGLAAAGSLTVNPEVMPGAERLTEIRSWALTFGAICVFSEPQYQPKLMAVVGEGGGAKSGMLDPLGALIDAGPDLYFGLLRDMASSVRVCLADGA